MCFFLSLIITPDCLRCILDPTTIHGECGLLCLSCLINISSHDDYVVWDVMRVIKVTRNQGRKFGLSFGRNTSQQPHPQT